jgi:hypothetical protein
LLFIWFLFATETETDTALASKRDL